MNRTIITTDDAATLDDLLALLEERSNALDADERLEDAIDLADLPTYGGDEPRDTHGIYSWDESRVLAYDNGWSIEAR